MLLQTDVRTPDVPVTPSIAESIGDYFEKGWHQRDGRALGVSRLIRGEPVVVDQDIFSSDQIKASDFYNECLLPWDVPWFAGVGFRAGPALWVLAMQRSARQGPVGDVEKAVLSLLSPRLAEVATLSSAVGRASLAGMTNVLDLVCKPAIALDRLGQVIDVNGAAHSLFGPEIYISNRSLIFSDQIANAELARFRETMRYCPDNQALIFDPIKVRRYNRAPLVIKILAVSGPARTPFLGARALLVFSDLGARTDIAEGLLKKLFGLTQAEERLARLIARGLSLDQAAKVSGITRDTVRNQLKAIFAKTETNRQSDLVALLSSL